MRIDSRYEFSGSRGFNDVVVGSGCKSLNFATLGIVRRKNNQRELLERRLRPQQAAESQTVNIGQFYVEQNKVARMPAQKTESGRCVCYGDRMMAGGLEDS